MAIPSRRAALTALGAGGVLAVAALFILRTSSPRPVKSAEPHGAEAAANAPPDTGTGPSPPAPASPVAAAPSAPVANDADAERALAAEIRSLVSAGRIGKARSLANAYFARFPDGPSGPELERLTGAHPTRDATDTRP